MQYYVYQFIDPANNTPFYIGKGSGYRLKQPRHKDTNPHLFNKIKKIRDQGLVECREIIKEFENETDAYSFEEELIHKIGLHNLCNIAPGGLGIGSADEHPSYKGDYLAGKRFGKLLVRERKEKHKNGHTKWLCQCDCGNEVLVYTSNLKRTSSCGCARVPVNKGDYLVGKKLGKLTVYSRTDNRNDNNEYLWLCECDCGNFVEKRSGSLVTGHTKSCGCLKTEKPTRGNYLSGRRFGKLTVMERDNKGKWGYSWLCQCDCGNHKTVLYSNLKRTKSCGNCVKKEIN